VDLPKAALKHKQGCRRQKYPATAASHTEAYGGQRSVLFAFALHLLPLAMTIGG